MTLFQKSVSKIYHTKIPYSILSHAPYVLDALHYRIFQLTKNPQLNEIFNVQFKQKTDAIWATAREQFDAAQLATNQLLESVKAGLQASGVNTNNPNDLLSQLNARLGETGIDTIGMQRAATVQGRLTNGVEDRLPNTLVEYLAHALNNGNNVRG